MGGINPAPNTSDGTLKQFHDENTTCLNPSDRKNQLSHLNLKSPFVYQEIIIHVTIVCLKSVLCLLLG